MEKKITITVTETEEKIQISENRVGVNILEAVGVYEYLLNGAKKFKPVPDKEIKTNEPY